MIFRDRQEAGKRLVSYFTKYQGEKNVIVLGLARGGVVVANEIAKALHLPLNVVVPRKIGAPGNPELALGAVMENKEGYFNSSIIRLLDVSEHYLKQEIEKESNRAKQRALLYRSHAPLPNVDNQTVILVDDGVATGATMLAAIKAMQQAHAAHVIVAVPVASTEALHLIQSAVKEVVCLHHRQDFGGVGYYYQDFSQVEDAEVIELLKQANQGQDNSPSSRQVSIKVKQEFIHGDLHIPSQPKGIVIFAHGSGSSRFSPRNQFVANYLQENQFATLLFDLLTSKEEEKDEITREFRFNIDLLAERLVKVTNWVLEDKELQTLPIGYFGSSTGAAAALIAAAEKHKNVQAVVSRGGRPDLASHHLHQVESPTLFIVGGNDTYVIELNRQAYEQLSCQKQLEIIPDATHLFEEPGTLEEVSRLASNWFLRYLIPKQG